MNMGREITDEFQSVLKAAKIEQKIKRSTFIGNISYCPSIQKAREFIRSISKGYADATHNCWAYRIITDEGYVSNYSDAGEPSGTAGKPIMDSIESHGLSNVVVVITRYFGGVKLGIRGLIDAYHLTADLTIEEAGIGRYILCEEIFLQTTYTLFSKIRSHLKYLGIDVKEAKIEFSNDVKITFPVPLSLIKVIEEFLSSLKSSGKTVQFHLVQQRKGMLL